MTFFCPSCWAELDRDYERCPSCGSEIKKLSESQNFIDKLIAALHHPEPETPIRAAWILGRLREARAIVPLYEIARETGDTFLRVAAIDALLRIGTIEANRLADLFMQDASSVERARIASIRRNHRDNTCDRNI